MLNCLTKRLEITIKESISDYIVTVNSNQSESEVFIIAVRTGDPSKI